MVERVTDEEKCEIGDQKVMVVNEIAEELQLLGKIVWPIVVTSFVLYSKSIISMLFLGRLGDTALAGGSLAIAFANITGYSVLKGLAMGMEPICCQAYGAKRWAVLSHTFQMTLILLFLFTIPISLLWLNLEPILLFVGQHSTITSVAQDYILYSLPDLLAQAFLHPLRIFLRTQNRTKPITICASFALVLHFPINSLLISYLGLGVRGVALASAWNTININLALVGYLLLSRTALKPWAGTGSSFAGLKDWVRLIGLAVLNAVSVCLEWWWYEVLLMLCGLLADPQPSVAAVGILIQTTGLIYVFPSSLSLGLSTRVGHELGAGRPSKAHLASTVGLTVAVGCGLLAFLFTLGVRDAWGRMFTGEPRILDLTTAVLPIVGFCELGNCPQTAGCGVLRGSARARVGAKINFGSFYLVGLPVAAVAGFKLGFGFVGLWMGLVAAQASCACLMMYAVGHTDWEAEADRTEELTRAGDGEKTDLEDPLLD